MRPDTKLFESSMLHERYEHFVHPSGLRVYVMPKDRYSTYASLSVPFGSAAAGWRDDNSEHRLLPGCAHFLEHRMFALPDGQDAFSVFASYGADANAYTSFHRTAYYFSTPGRLEKCLSLLFQCVTDLRLDDEAVENEKGIICEEIGMYEDSPDDFCFSKMLENMYESNPVRNNICGTADSVRRMTPAMLREAYEHYYRLQDMILVICGKTNAEEVYNALVKISLPTPATAKTGEEIRVTERKTPLCAYREYYKQTAVPQFAIGVKDSLIPKDPAERVRRDIMMNLLDDMLLSKSGQWYEQMTESGYLQPSFSYGYTIDGTEAYHALTGESKNASAVRESFISLAQRTRRDPPGRDVFERCRRAVLSDFIKCFDSAEEIAGELLSFAEDGFDLLSYPQVLAGITYEEVVACLDETFRPEQICMSVVLPRDAR